MPNYNVDLNMQNMFANPTTTGKQYGSMIGDIAGGVAKVGEGIKQDNNKAKVQQLIADYDAKSGPFAGLEGSVATKRLSQLLLPLDPELSSQYAKKAETEGADELNIKRNKEVVAAGAGVSDEEVDTDAEAANAEEIALIEAELAARGERATEVAELDKQIAGYKYEGVSGDGFGFTPNSRENTQAYNGNFAGNEELSNTIRGYSYDGVSNPLNELDAMSTSRMRPEPGKVPVITGTPTKGAPMANALRKPQPIVNIGESSIAPPPMPPLYTTNLKGVPLANALDDKRKPNRYSLGSGMAQELEMPPLYRPSYQGVPRANALDKKKKKRIYSIGDL